MGHGRAATTPPSSLPQALDGSAGSTVANLLNTLEVLGGNAHLLGQWGDYTNVKSILVQGWCSGKGTGNNLQGGVVGRRSEVQNRARKASYL